MPELPEVEVVRTALDQKINHHRLLAVTVNQPQLRYPVPDFSLLLHHRLVAVRRRAKYLLLDFECGQTVLWHLGMSGQFHILKPDAIAAAHEHIQWDFDDQQSLRYRDPRRFGYVGICPTIDCNQHRWLKHLGLEPLSDDFSRTAFISALEGRRAAIKNIIMNPRVVVGVGNIYAAESLFMAKIDPRKETHRISKKRLMVLRDAIREVLRAAIDAGGSTIQNFSRPDGRPGYFSHTFQVYSRTGKPCFHCGNAINQCTQQSRSTFFCAHCQR